LRIEAASRSPVSSTLAPGAGSSTLAPGAGSSTRPLIPFGGGLDSIVTVEGLRPRVDDAALFVVSRAGDRFDAIELAAAVTGWPVVRAERQLDPKILRSRELGYRNGHVPVTGVISAIAVAAALLDGRDAVVMSNEWSASSGNGEHDGRIVNHQWSKSLAFEDLFRAALAEAVAAPIDYYSWLRPFSELWVANRFTDLDRYHLAFRSCNRAFHIDRALRLDHWCGHCDKCCFIDLILAPFLPRERLEAVFGGNEPLGNAELTPQFRALLGTSGDIKPFECVGDVDECRVAVLLAADRPDRGAPVGRVASADRGAPPAPGGDSGPGGSPVLQMLAAEVRPLIPGDVAPFAATLLRPLSEHRIPAAHAPDDLLV
jgi:UDP-N-acetyl-alpha-D-muramoyl-L-alanyl-L-glutamate epimerase